MNLNMLMISTFGKPIRTNPDFTLNPTSNHKPTTWCSNWQILLNKSKTNYMIFYQKKELPSPPNKQLTTDETPLRRIKKTATTNPWNRYY